MADRIPTHLPVFRVHTGREALPVDGADSCIAVVPPGVYGRDGHLDVRLFGRMLRDLGDDLARRAGGTVHHAEWTITSDPEVLEFVGMCTHGDCGRCRSSVDQALAMLRDRPYLRMLAGVVYWAGRADA